MKVALLQTNPTVGALEANADRLLELSQRAADAGATLAIAPELAVLGYPPRDLLERPAFLRRVAHATERIVREAAPGPTLVFGTVARTGSCAGRPLHNQALAVRNGSVVGKANKQLLPTYDVFDEARHFEPGSETTVLSVAGSRVALTICEDAWCGTGPSRNRYCRDPLDSLDRDGVDLIVNLSASPFTLPKLSERAGVFRAAAKKHGVPIVLVNQVGGNDELIFDGRSTVWSPSGDVRARARAFDEDFLVAETGEPGTVAPEPSSEEEAAYLALLIGVRDYARKCGFTRAVLGLSGGIDSALTATIAADALGPANVMGIAMPTRYSSEGSIRDAAVLAERLGIAFRTIDIDPIFQAYLDGLSPTLDSIAEPHEGEATLENVQARIRGATIMAISNRTGALVLTTGNKSEIAVGYCTLYGDMVGGLAVISDVPKTMVYRVARWVNRGDERIPRSSIEKPPSAELRDGQLDTDSLPPYDELDPILEAHIEAGLDRDSILQRGHDRDLTDRVLYLVRSNEYKRRQMAPGLIITRKAFGVGRRIPIAQGYRDQ